MNRLPIALVERWPNKKYVDLYISKEEALKANVRDAHLMHRELQYLRKQFLPESEIKSVKKHNKVLNAKTRTRDKWLDDLIKYSDYAAMLMAAYPDAKFLDRGAYDEIKDTVDQSVIIRGIAAGWILDNQLKRGLDTWFIETGYLGNYPGPSNEQGRKIWHRVVKNQMQQTHVLDVPPDRYQRLVQFDPKLEYHGWRKNRGRKILLVSPSEKPCKYYGINRDEWVANTIDTLRQHTDRPIITRDKRPRWDRSQNSIYDLFDTNDIWAVVTYNSIAAVEAVQVGIPAFALAETAAKPVANNDLSLIENPWMADERFVRCWLASLAYGQFSLEEIISGRAWRLLQANERRRTIDY